MTLANQEKTNTAKQKATKQTTKHTNTNNQRQVSLDGETGGEKT